MSLTEDDVQIRPLVDSGIIQCRSTPQKVSSYRIRSITKKTRFKINEGTEAMERFNTRNRLSYSCIYTYNDHKSLDFLIAFLMNRSS